MKTYITTVVFFLLSAIGVHAQQTKNQGFVTDNINSEVKFYDLTKDQMKADLLFFDSMDLKKGTSIKLPSQRAVDVNLSSSESMAEDLRVLNKANIDNKWGYETITAKNLAWFIDTSEVVDLENEIGFFGNSSVTTDGKIEYTWMSKLKDKGLKFRGLAWKKLDCFNTIKVKAEKINPNLISEQKKQDDFFAKPYSEAERQAVHGNYGNYGSYGCGDCQPSSHPCPGPSYEYVTNYQAFTQDLAAVRAAACCNPTPCCGAVVVTTNRKPHLGRALLLLTGVILISSLCITVY